MSHYGHKPRSPLSIALELYISILLSYNFIVISLSLSLSRSTCKACRISSTTVLYGLDWNLFSESFYGQEPVLSLARPEIFSSY